MSKADIQYMPLTTDPARYNHDLITELTQANIWLAGGLHEERMMQRGSEQWRMALAIMLAVTVTLLVLTWTGYISI
ncbi:hypothetical protein [Enterocloster citroniae]|uniref:Uncharacterized protein n=2 Tax=Enterocloster citroniae TaxID=358743 RepID=A0ABV2G3G4_9FIRM|nr:hypothetical protein [Enterocloster citroniae]KMW23724.1 hypothetical protein HMPREF9470_00940 [[Clostridium] citroniae WAL-19142]MCB7067040.1 hypothetical protein [Enterocloster citroniae]